MSALRVGMVDVVRSRTRWVGLVRNVESAVVRLAGGARAVAVAVGVLGVLLTPGSARADFGVAAFDGSAVQKDGTVSSQAGGHPYELSTTFDLNTTLDTIGNVTPDGGSVKDILVDLPAGLIGNPTAVGRCSMSAFLTGAFDPGAGFLCPASSQVGVAAVNLGLGSSPGVPSQKLPLTDIPVFSLEPPPGAVASFGFIAAQPPVFFDAYVSSVGGYHVSIVVRDASQAVEVLGSSVTLWGVPSDPAHDVQRACQGTTEQGCSTEHSGVPFLTNPTSCPAVGDGVVTRLRADSWSNPGVFAEARFLSHLAPGYSLTNPVPRGQWGAVQGTTGCERLPFAPTMRVHPDSTLRDSPTGFTVELSFPQDGLVNADGLATAHLKEARVTLPEGMSVSPSSADGLQSCSDAQIGIGTDNPVSCPEGSKIGTVAATTPVLDEPLGGSVFVGSQKSDEPASGEMFRIFLVIENEARGVLVKLPGKIIVKPNGEIEAVFANNPQFPISEVSVHLKTGPRAPLATPADCGPHTVRAMLTSWAGQTVNVRDTFTIDCPPSPDGFAPALSGGAVNPTGAAFSPFVVRIDRPDRQQFLSGVTLTTPGGLLAKLKGVPLCNETNATAGTCPLDTRVGTATVGAGPGPAPFFLNGPVSITGPYNGAPYGLAVAVRAVAGPFDLGTVVVRQGVFIDPVDAHLTVRSDALPVVVKGVPVRLRTVAVQVDRPGFTINPTSCAPKQIQAVLTSTRAATATPTVRFQLADCAPLGFAPKLAVRLTGKGQTRDGAHPGLKATLTQPAHQAGIRGVAVRLPLSLALDPQNAASDSLCEFEEGQKPDPHCPKSSIIGKAKATTPLLNRPLSGNVYFVKNIRIDKKTGRKIRTLPTLLLALRGEVSLNVRANSSISHNKLVSTFPTIPDAPVTRFDLTLNGGRKGILVVTNDQNLCTHLQKVTTILTAHNTKQTTPTTIIKTPCKH